MSKHDDEFCVEGVKEHIAAIKSYMPKSKDAFLSDEKTQDSSRAFAGTRRRNWAPQR